MKKKSLALVCATISTLFVLALCAGAFNVSATTVQPTAQWPIPIPDGSGNLTAQWPIPIPDGSGNLTAQWPIPIPDGSGNIQAV